MRCRCAAKRAPSSIALCCTVASVKVRPVGRKKTQLSRSERYARLIAAWRGVELLFSHAFGNLGPRSVRIESEQGPGWDDIVEEMETDVEGLFGAVGR